MTDMDRLFEEMVGLRNEVREVGETAARTEERVAAFTSHHEERARKHSDRVEKVEARASSLEKWRWVLAGAWVSIPVAWAVFQALNGER